MATTASSTEWTRVINTTIRDYLRGEEEAVMRRRVLLALLKKRGRIKYNQSGDGVDWKVRYRRADMIVNNGQQTLTFSGEERHKSAFLDFQGYAITDAITKREKLKNRGTAAIIKIYDRMIPLLMEDMDDQFAEELYIDSSASGNSGRMSGIETMMATNGTVTISSGAQRSANAADVVGYPNDTYATLSTVLGNYGGTWNTQSDIATTWPAGRGDASYDFFSPVITCYNSTAFNGTADTWAQQCVEATRFTLRKLQRNKSKGTKFVLLDDELYRQYLDKIDSKERINVPASEMVDLGFSDSFKQDGAEITSEYGIPGSVGYVFSLDDMELLSLQDQLFAAEGPEYDMASRSWRVAVDCLGQLKFKSPRNFGKLMTIAA